MLQDGRGALEGPERGGRGPGLGGGSPPGQRQLGSGVPASQGSCELFLTRRERRDRQSH